MSAAERAGEMAFSRAALLVVLRVAGTAEVMVAELDLESVVQLVVEMVEVMVAGSVW